ncbi:MAG: hypothetical protein ACTSR8_16635 [Promethearchaeota archaeon]
MDDQIIKDFESKLTMFENSIKNLSDGFLTKLEDLSTKTNEIAENTEFLKRMKKIFDEQNKKLELMDATIKELSSRLDILDEQGIGKSSKKKKKKK